MVKHETDDASAAEHNEHDPAAMDPDEFDPEVVAELRKRAKVELRKRTRALRNTIPEASLAVRSSKICAALESRAEMAAAGRVALFHPIAQRHEVDVRELDARLRALGKRIAYPSIDASKRMTFRWVDDPADLAEGGASHRALGFADPGPSAPEASELDIIVVPALLIDARGFRLGYGAGYYDQALPRFAPPAAKVGVIFDFQLAAEVPNDPWDVPLDVIVTDERVLEVASA